MMTVTLYWPDTGEIHICVTVSRSALLSVDTEQGMEWVQIPTDENLHWMPNGVKTDRPKLTSDTAQAPLDVDCSLTGGEVVFRNEMGDEATETGIMTLTDPGEYEIEPPFPWQMQRVVLS